MVCGEFVLMPTDGGANCRRMFEGKSHSILEGAARN
jgi:hypothetical protein